MKNTLLVIAVLIIGACGKDKEPLTKTKVTDNNATKPAKEITEEDVVGAYEHYYDGRADTIKYVILANGIAESYLNGTKIERIGNWIISKEGELYIQFYPSTDVYRINKDGSLTEIATAHVDGTIKDKPKEYQETYKKIK